MKITCFPLGQNLTLSENLLCEWKALGGGVNNLCLASGDDAPGGSISANSVGTGNHPRLAPLRYRTEGYGANTLTSLNDASMPAGPMVYSHHPVYASKLVCFEPFIRQ